MAKSDAITQQRSGKLDRFASLLVGSVLVLVPFHAFLTVWASTAVGHFTLLRLWDEAALAVLVVYGFVCLWQDAPLRAVFLRSQLVRLIGLYTLLMVVCGLVAYSKHEVSLKASAYAVTTDLRFLVWMLAVWIAAVRSEWLSRNWRRLIYIPLSVVVVFGLLQFFVLPHDFLKHFGYNNSVSYVAAVTLNQDSSTLRVQSFLRGSNPLGAYLAAILAMLVAELYYRRNRWQYWLLTAASAVTLFLTFSRSAWLGVMVSLIALGWFVFQKHRKAYLVAVGSLCVLAASALVVLHKSGGVQNALLHSTDHSTAVVTSNQGHESALRSSLSDLRAQPFGRGPGTAGQASIYNTGNHSRNTESFWLQIALELGWPGLMIFAAILIQTGRELWARRRMTIALGLLASLCGLVIVNMFSYGWSDDTVAFVWWGLAGIALGLKAPKGT